jgi:hypothetical protein
MEVRIYDRSAAALLTHAEAVRLGVVIATGYESVSLLVSTVASQTPVRLRRQCLPNLEAE